MQVVKPSAVVEFECLTPGMCLQPNTLYVPRRGQLVQLAAADALLTGAAGQPAAILQFTMAKEKAELSEKGVAAIFAALKPAPEQHQGITAAAAAAPPTAAAPGSVANVALPAAAAAAGTAITAPQQPGMTAPPAARRRTARLLAPSRAGEAAAHPLPAAALSSSAAGTGGAPGGSGLVSGASFLDPVIVYAVSKLAQ